MAQDTQVGVNAASETEAFVPGGWVIGADAVVGFYGLGEIALGAPGDGDAARFYHRAQELYAVPAGLQIDFPRVQVKVQFVTQIGADNGYEGGQVRAVLVDEHHVVHVTAVMADVQGMLDEVVEGVQVEVGEYLAGQVADGKPPNGPLSG